MAVSLEPFRERGRVMLCYLLGHRSHQEQLPDQHLQGGERLPRVGVRDQVAVPVVVRVVNEKNRSWGKGLSPCDPKNGPACSAPRAW